MSNDRSFVAVFRASSAVRLAEGEQILLKINDPAGTIGGAIRTRYVDETVGKSPREIWLEVFGHGDSLEQTMHGLHDRATSIAGVLSLICNAAIDELQMELMFDVTEGETRHQFLQNSLLDETGLPRLSRRLHEEDVIAVMKAIMESPRMTRLYRAIGQYETALRHCFPGHELMALAHLWMATEALTPIARDRELALLGPGSKALDLATDWGIDIKEVDSQVRQRVIFAGHDVAFTAAKSASDGFEHGFAATDKVRAVAVEHYREVSGLVRRAIFDLADLPREAFDRLTTEKYDNPVPCQRFQKQIHGTLVGSADALTEGDYLYPMFRLESSIDRVQEDAAGMLSVDPREHITPMLPKDVTFEDFRFEIWGADGRPRVDPAVKPEDPDRTTRVPGESA